MPQLERVTLGDNAGGTITDFVLQSACRRLP